MLSGGCVIELSLGWIIGYLLFARDYSYYTSLHAWLYYCLLLYLFLYVIVCWGMLNSYFLWVDSFRGRILKTFSGSKWTRAKELNKTYKSLETLDTRFPSPCPKVLSVVAVAGDMFQVLQGTLEMQLSSMLGWDFQKCSFFWISSPPMCLSTTPALVHQACLWGVLSGVNRHLFTFPQEKSHNKVIFFFMATIGL